MDYLKLTDDHLNVNDIYSLVTSPKCGANSIFVGTTRDNFDGKKVVQLEYQAYEEMALKTMRQVCQHIRESEEVEHLAIYHRLGVVPVGEASVVIAASSPHKLAAANAVNAAIKALKGKVPIWKKEIYADGQGTWKENKECKWGADGEPSQR